MGRGGHTAPWPPHSDPGGADRKSGSVPKSHRAANTPRRDSARDEHVLDEDFVVALDGLNDWGCSSMSASKSGDGSNSGLGDDDVYFGRTLRSSPVCSRLGGQEGFY